MKYKLLLMGKNAVLMEVFFTHMRDNFECLSTSVRTDDIFNHLKYFTPDAVVYCPTKDAQENVSQIVACKTKLQEDEIPFVIAGSDVECEEFNKASFGMADMFLTRPFTASLLTEKLVKWLDARQEKEDIEAQNQEEMRKILEQEKKKHVLVIDDDPIILRLIREYLHEEYEVGTALSGKVAMKFLEKKTVDLILLDFEMPDENGPAVLQKLHANEMTKDIPVIFLTGITDKNKVKEALVQRPQDYVLKPIEKTKLLDTIKRFIK